MDVMDMDYLENGNNDESLLSEDHDDDWEEPSQQDTLEQRFVKIQKDFKNKRRNKDHQLPPLKKKLFKIKVNDLLFSKHYKQLKDCVLDGRIQKMDDIEKMLNAEPVDEDRCLKESNIFLKRRKDEQLLRDLCEADYYAEHYHKDKTSSSDDSRNSEPENIDMKVEPIDENDDDTDAYERLLEEWTF